MLTGRWLLAACSWLLVLSALFSAICILLALELNSFLLQSAIRIPQSEIDLPDTRHLTPDT